jgi:competence protein ComEC
MEMREPLWNRRPLVYGAIGALLGGLLSLRLTGLWLLLPGALALCLAGWLLYRWKSLFLLPLCLGLALLRGLFLPQGILPAGEALLSGTVWSLPVSGEDEQTVLLRQLEINGVSRSGALELSLPEEQAVNYGDRLTLQVRLRPESDAHADLRGQAEALSDPEITRGGAPLLYGWALKLRSALEKRIELLFGHYAPEAKGMLLGEKKDMGYGSYRAFLQSGLLHLLTVSGLHVGIVCGGILTLFRGRRRWLRALLSGSVLLLYSALTGFSPSTLRASVMVFTLFLLRTGSWEEDNFSALALAFSLLVVLDPRYLESLGFCLSFGSVFGLLMLTQPLEELLPARTVWGEVLRTAFAGALAAMLGTMPLLARTTGQVQWIGILLSPLVLPIAALFLVPGWLALGLDALWHPLGKLASLLPKGVLAYILKVTELGIAAPLYPPAPGPVACLLWFLGLFGLSPYFLPNRSRPPWVGYGLLGASMLLWLLGV